MINYGRLGILNEPRFSGSFSVPQKGEKLLGDNGTHLNIMQQYIFRYTLGKQIPLQRGALAQIWVNSNSVAKTTLRIHVIASKLEI